MNNTFFTADIHAYHANIAGPKVSTWKSGYRDFDSIEHMNETLIENLNKDILQNDTLYFIGDWTFGGKDKIELFRKRINCKDIRVCLGNHDHHIKKDRELQKLFTWVKPIFNGTIVDRFFCLNHYSQKIWEHSHHGSIHLFGHSHSTLPDDPNSLSIDVGMDTCLFGHKKYTPYHYDEIIDIMDKHKSYKSVDHHNQDTN